MTALYVLGAIALLLTALCLTRISIRVRYDSIYGGGLTVYAGVGFLRYRLHPPKEKKVKKERRVREKPEKKKKIAEKKEAKKPSLGEIFAIIKEARNIVGKLAAKFGQALRLRAHRVEIVVATDDAAKTALAYGAACQAAAYLIEFLTLHFDCKVKNAAVWSDFSRTEPSARLDLKLSVRIGALFGIAFSSAWAIAMLYLKLKKTTIAGDS